MTTATVCGLSPGALRFSVASWRSISRIRAPSSALDASLRCPHDFLRAPRPIPRASGRRPCRLQPAASRRPFSFFGLHRPRDSAAPHRWPRWWVPHRGRASSPLDQSGLFCAHAHVAAGRHRASLPPPGLRAGANHGAVAAGLRALHWKGPRPSWELLSKIFSRILRLPKLRHPRLPPRLPLWRRLRLRHPQILPLLSHRASPAARTRRSKHPVMHRQSPRVTFRMARAGRLMGCRHRRERREVTPRTPRAGPF